MRLSADDIPYGDDWQNVTNVATWIDAADRTRPWRALLRERIAAQVGARRPGARILELGSGPGLLAECILERCSNVSSYTLLDFSPHMLAASRVRLARFPFAHFVSADFKSENWIESAIGPFDAIVSMQAVHELRHKRHARTLYQQIHQVAAPLGQLLVCDHLPIDSTPRSQALYLTEQEQLVALAAAGFGRVETVVAMNGLLLCRAEKHEAVAVNCSA